MWYIFHGGREIDQRRIPCGPAEIRQDPKGDVWPFGYFPKSRPKLRTGLAKSSPLRGKAFVFFICHEGGGKTESGPLLGVPELPDEKPGRMPGMGISGGPVLLAGEWNLLLWKGGEKLGSENGRL